MENTIQDLEMTIFRDLIDIFKSLQGFKFKHYLTASKFRKLGNYAFMRNERFKRVDYDILYKTVELKSENQLMDFYGFIFAFETIAQRMFPEEFEEDSVEVLEGLIG